MLPLCGCDWVAFPPACPGQPCRSHALRRGLGYNRPIERSSPSIFQSQANPVEGDLRHEHSGRWPAIPRTIPPNSAAEEGFPHGNSVVAGAGHAGHGRRHRRAGNRQPALAHVESGTDVEARGRRRARAPGGCSLRKREARLDGAARLRRHPHRAARRQPRASLHQTCGTEPWSRRHPAFARRSRPRAGGGDRRHCGIRCRPQFQPQGAVLSGTRRPGRGGPPP